MPIFAALGAKCTVVDNSEKQLLKEKKLLKENYEINIIKADITKSLPFADEVLT